MEMDKNLQKIYKASLQFLMPTSLEETYATIIKEASRLIGGDIGSILLYKQGELERVYSTSEALYKIKPRKNGITYSVFKSRQPKILSTQQIAKIHPEIKETQTSSDILIPITNRNKTIGVLSIMSTKTDAFNEKHLNTLMFFAPMASLAIRKAQLYSELKQALEVRDRFIALAAHELRTPLTSVNGYIQLLRNKMDKKGTTESEWVYQLWRESIRLTNLVSELLEINKIRSGQLHYYFKESDIKVIITRAQQDFNFTHPDRKITFLDQVPHPTAIIIGDFDKLVQVVTNLVDNAVKYSHVDTEIKIYLKQSQRYFEIIIQDYGKGISKRDLPRIFDGFYKGEENFKEGMGLGLYLANEIIKSHFGTIKVNSKVGIGTAIKVKLPKIKL